MGAVFAPGESYLIDSESGAILLIIEARELTAHARGISSPQRAAGATWPSDVLMAKGSPDVAYDRPYSVQETKQIGEHPFLGGVHCTSVGLANGKGRGLRANDSSTASSATRYHST